LKITHIKKLLCKPEKLLQQLVRRYAEIEMLPLAAQNRKNKSSMNFRKSHNSGSLIDGYNFTAQFCGGITIAMRVCSTRA